MGGCASLRRKEGNDEILSHSWRLLGHCHWGSNILFRLKGGYMKQIQYKKPIIIRKIRDDVWQKFRVICKKQGIKSANRGTIQLIEDCVAKYESEYGEVVCN